MKNTIIIGGSGFVGTRLIKSLGEENVSNFDKNESPFYKRNTTIGNVLNPKELNASLKGYETVVLLAAEHRDDVSPTSLYYDVNVTGTQNVLNAMDLNGIKNLIFTSSVAVYGLNKVNPSEKTRVDPFNHYGKSKWEAEKLINNWYNNETNKSVTILRPTVIFGERNRGNVYNLLKQIASGRFLMIGKGVNKKSMAYVGNIVAFIKDRLKSKHNGFEIYNYVDKPDFTMAELAELIQNKLNLNKTKIKIPFWMGMIAGYFFDFLAISTKKKFFISSVRIKKFCATTEFDASKVQKVFKAPFTLKEGLNKTLDYEFNFKKNDTVVFYSE